MMNATIKEANRYIANAKEILSEKANRSNGIYQDKKYVKLAGHAAYCGVLYALDDLIIKPIKSKRKSVDFYRAFLTSYDKKMLVEFNNLYDILHLSMGYDGNTDAGIAKRGIEMAKEFISKIAVRLN
jgi:Domain of unknown function (DUF5618)